MIRKIILLFSAIMASACSILVPYEEDFACRNKTKMGKCVTVEEAYQEARSNGDYYAHLGEEDIKSSGKKPVSNTTDKPIHENLGEPHTFYGYKNREYRELSGMIDKPVTPMVKSPKVLRTLIIPYKDKQGKSSILYMDRYVYSIVEESEFVLGDYLNPRKGNAFISNQFYQKKAQ